MRRNRTDRDDLRRFLIAATGFAVFFGALGRLFGQSVAMQLQQTPTTTDGWLFIGWLVAAPPYLLVLNFWSTRRLLDARQRRNRTYLLTAWIGAGMFIAPARLDSVDSQFGTGALVGEPLSTGWAWGMLATVIGAVFTVVVLQVLRRSVPGGATMRQRTITLRFLERAWLVLVLVSLGFALYGNETGVFNGGT